jgi:hypothetical protein
LPHIEKAYERYKDDEGVAFVLVSIDDDRERLQRYLNERSFQMPVARLSSGEAEALLGVTDIPAGFYVDAKGIVRFEVEGGETHGDSALRVSWYIEELKRQ